MVSIIRRGLFWPVYLTLLGSLVLVAILAATLWHELAQQPMPGGISESGATIGALLPGADAPTSQLESALRRLSLSVDGPVTMIDPGGHAEAAAQAGRIVPLPDPALSRAIVTGSHVAVLRSWRAHLPDGRTLLVESRTPLAAGGPHILAMLMAIAAAVGLAAYPIVSRLTRRLERLRTSLNTWGAGALGSRAKVEGRDEIAAVAASFNAAADQIDQLLAAHRTLLVHASHELRSPLARLRIAVEMFAAAPDAGLRAAIVGDIAELDALVEEILLASRLDHAPVLLERERVDCLALAAEEAARGGAELRHAGGEASSFEIRGSPRLLRRLIRNLIDNAGKHGAPPVEIELSHAGPSGDGLIIAVHDHGPGIPPSERGRVFEPFYRPSGRAEAAGSWGLGLSIVRQIALRHGGAATCEPRPDGGGSFVVVLPAGTDGPAGVDTD